MIHATTPGRLIDTSSPIRKFGRVTEITELPNLVEIQTSAYEEFLAPSVPSANRQNQGLESLLGEIFPIYSYDKTMCLEYVGYELGRPRYTIDECRKPPAQWGGRCGAAARRSDRSCAGRSSHRDCPETPPRRTGTA